MKKTAGVAVVVAVLFTLLQARVGRNEGPEASAIAALRAVVTGQAAYAARFGGYARSLQVLATPCAFGDVPFISQDFAAQPAIFGAYEIRLLPQNTSTSGNRACRGNETTATFYAAAIPIGQDASRRPAFGVDQIGVIWMDTSGVAPQPPFHESVTVRPIK